MREAVARLRAEGALHVPAVLDRVSLDCLDAFCLAVPRDRPGVRLKRLPNRAIPEPIAAAVAATIGKDARPVRSLLFDKTARTNWALGWHQDRSITVRARTDRDGFEHWAVKQGLTHVEPPFDISAAMVTVRLHLDDVDAGNAPLTVACGSHRHGRVADDRAASLAARHRPLVCHARRGDAWLYATPILHRSAAAERPGRRRVVQIDFAATDLPDGLDWLGVELFAPACAA